MNKIVFNRWLAGPPPHFVCDHTQEECAHGPHGAAAAILKAEIEGFEKSYADTGQMTFKITDIEAVYFGPFDEAYEPAVPEEGLRARDPADEVRILYWWGNSNLYHPTTLERWDRALAHVALSEYDEVGTISLEAWAAL